MRRNWTVAWMGWISLGLAACSSSDPAGSNIDPNAGAPGAGGSGAPVTPAAMGTGGSVGGASGTGVENMPTPVLPSGGASGNAPSGGPPALEGDCSVPPPPSQLIGWASEGTGTTGGAGAAPVVVTNPDDFEAAIEGTDPRVIHLQGAIEGIFSIGSNKTVIGVCGASIRGHIGFNGASNSILRNLKVIGFNCTDSPADCSGGDDAITVGGGSNHIWVDHLDVSDGSDGNLDVTQGSDFVTVSWTKFSYSTRRTDPLAGDSGHRFSNLIGSSDTDTRDPGHLNVTYHHSWWADNVDQRMPRTRRGQIHVFNNLYTSAGNSYCTDAGFEAKLLVQNNVYIGVNRPLETRDGGQMLAEGNLFQNITGDQAVAGTGFTPPYAFSVDATAGLEAAIRAGAGPQ